MFWIWLSIILTILYLIMIYFEWDRSLYLRFSSVDSLIKNYQKKPKKGEKRVVLILNCLDGLCSYTIKSLLDQSIKVDSISVQTNYPEKINPELLKVVTVHKPSTEFLREPEKNTLILYLQNKKEYKYDDIEIMIENKS